tara:strand:+ start:989 stop:1162 length:174 start_codon:yes stop_codon:yes gene_type:complete
MGFILERVKSLASKKLGAALAGESIVAGSPLQGYPLMVYIAAQAVLEGFKYWSDKQA